MQQKRISTTKAFANSVAVILALTSAAKIFSATGHAKVLDIPEALLPMTVRQSLWSVGIIEAAVVLLLWLHRSQRIKLLSVAWLSGNFLLYRIFTILLTVGRPCPCLGSITEKIPLKPATIDHILSAIVAYMFFGSLFFLLWSRGRTEPLGTQDEMPAPAAR